MGHENLRIPDILPPGRRIILVDIDGTLVEGLTISAFAKYLDDNHYFNYPSLENMQEDGTRYKSSDHSHSDYERFALDLVSHYAEGIKDKNANKVQAMADEFFSSVKRNEVRDYQIYTFSSQLIHLMNRIGTTIAISGSPVESLIPLKRTLNLGELRGTTLKQENGIYTGEIEVNLALDYEKEKIVTEYIADDIDIDNSFAFGDTMHDLPLLEVVGNPFVVGTNPELLAFADNKGWPKINSDNALNEVMQRVNILFKR